MIISKKEKISISLTKDEVKKYIDADKYKSTQSCIAYVLVACGEILELTDFEFRAFERFSDGTAEVTGTITIKQHYTKGQ